MARVARTKAASPVSTRSSAGATGKARGSKAAKPAAPVKHVRIQEPSEGGKRKRKAVEEPELDAESGNED